MVKIITEKPHMEGNLVRRVSYDRSRKVECEIRRENETVFLCFNLKNFFHSLIRFLQLHFIFNYSNPFLRIERYCIVLQYVLWCTNKYNHKKFRFLILYSTVMFF
jgi:hypothetical protein